MKQRLRSTVIVCTLLGSSCLGYAQAAPAASGGIPAQNPSSSYEGDSGSVGIGVKISTLGAGAEVGVRVTHRTNIRAGFNVITYSRGFNENGIPLQGQVNFKSFEAHYDISPWAKSFHVSPGVLVYAADPVTGTAAIAGNKSFSLGGVDYTSDPANPVTGSGKVTVNRAAPTVTVGWGNLVPRKEGKHFSIPVEFGVAFQGAPKTHLSLAGSACDSTGANCLSVTNPAIQANIVAEQNKINSNVSFLKAYPILSVGFGYKF